MPSVCATVLCWDWDPVVPGGAVHARHLSDPNRLYLQFTSEATYGSCEHKHLITMDFESVYPEQGQLVVFQECAS